MTTAGEILLRERVTGGNNPAYQVSQDAWDDSIIVEAGSGLNGYVMVRDDTQPDGWGFETDVVVNSIEADTIYVGSTDTPITRAAAGVVTFTALRLGANPPTNTAGIGLTNNEAITFRQAGGAGNYPLIKSDASNNIIVGGTGVANVLLLNTIKPNTTATDIGASSDPFRSGYFGTSLLVGTTFAVSGAGGVLGLPNGSDNGIAFLNAAGTNYHVRLQMTAAGHFWIRSMATGVVQIESFLAFSGVTSSEVGFNTAGLLVQVKRGDNTHGAVQFQVGDSSAIGGQGSFGIAIQSGNPYAHLAVGSGDTTLANVSKGAGATVYGGLFQVAMKMTGASASHYALGVFPTSLADGSARTVTQQVGLIVIAGQKGANVTVTTAYGIRIQAPTIGATNYPVYIEGGTSYLGDAVSVASSIVVGDGSSTGITIATTGTTIAQTGNLVFSGRAQLKSTANGKFSLLTNDGSAGVLLDFVTDSLVKVFARDGSSAAGISIANNGYIQFGNSPAQSGYIRLNYSGVHIVARRNDGAADIEAFKVATVNSATNIAILGRECSAIQLSAGNVVVGFGSYNDAAYPALRRASANLEVVTSDGGGYTGLLAGTITGTAFKVGAAAGVDFGPGLPVSLTIVKGIVTAAS